LSVGIGKKVKPGEVAVIFGQELVALGIVPVLKERNVAKIITADISELRRKASKEIGADIVVNPLKEDIIEIVMEETKGMGAEFVVVMDERPIAIQQAMHVVRQFGKIWLTKPSAYMQLNPAVVNMHPINWRMADAGYAEPPIKFDPSLFSMQTAWGTLGLRIPRFLEAIDLMKSGIITAQKYVTDIFPLEKTKEAFDRGMDFNGTIEVMVEP